jgi:hypothetical protein
MRITVIVTCIFQNNLYVIPCFELAAKGSCKGTKIIRFLALKTHFMKEKLTVHTAYAKKSGGQIDRRLRNMIFYILKSQFVNMVF